MREKVIILMNRYIADNEIEPTSIYISRSDLNKFLLEVEDRGAREVFTLGIGALGNPPKMFGMDVIIEEGEMRVE